MTAPASTHVITAARVPVATGPLLIPNGAGWTEGEYPVSLVPTPLDAQPSEYVRTSWAQRPYGQLATVRLSAALTDSELYIRLRWLTPEPRNAITDNNVFADACAVLFPRDGRSAELATMGDEERPVQAWHWRAGTDTPFVIDATGLGTTSRIPIHGVGVAASWDRSEWTVVFSRAIHADGVPLEPGRHMPIGVAVWRGSLGERAGLKSHTPEWLSLRLPG